MIRVCFHLLTTTAPLRLAAFLVVLCVGFPQVSYVRATPLFPADKQAVPEPVTSEESTDDRLQSVLTDEEVLRLKAEKQDSIDRLEKTASEIARRWKEKQARKTAGGVQKNDPKSGSTLENSQDDSKSASHNPSKKSPESADPSEDAKASDIGTADAGQPVMGNEMPGKTKSTAESSSQDKQDAGSVSAIPVPSIVDGPIDRLALATSLFATKELRECLKILEAVELRPLSVEDQQWHDYLAASCYRDLGNRSEAEGMYRSVLQRSSSTWVSAAARWWLDHIDERAELEQKLQDVETTLDNWRMEIDALKKAN